MRRTVFLIAALVAATALVPPPAEAQPTPVPSALFLSSTTGTAGTASGVLTLTTTPPSKADDSRSNISGASAAWYAPPGTIPGAAGEATFDGDVVGTAHIESLPLTTPLGGLPIGVLFRATVEFGLFKLSANGTEVFLGNASVELLPQFTAPVANATSTNFTIPRPSVPLLSGEALFLNVSATAVGLANVAMLYDSLTHPSGFNVTMLPVARGNLQLSATTVSRDAAPGGTPATFVVSVRNLATDTDTVRLNATGTPADFTVRVNPAQLTLAGGSSGSVLVSVTVPAGTADGTRHTATVSAESSNGGAAQTLTLTTNVRVATTTPGDRDGDGYTDADETRYSSNPNDRNSTPDNTDSDGDGVSNRAEVDANTDPFDANDFPGAGGNNNNGGGFGGRSGSLLGPLSDPIASAMGVDSATADLLAILLILLFLLIIALLIWYLFLGYPVVVSLVEPRASTEPGRGADFAVEVRSKLGRSQQVDLEAAGLPSDWDVRFNKPHLTLDAKSSEVVGMLVRPPGGWPAPSKRDFEVRARSRLKPEKFAKALAKLSIDPRSAAAVEPPQEEGVAEPGAWEPEPERAPAPVPYVVPVPAGGEAAAFRVAIHDVRHAPPVPERGAEVTTTARVDNNGPTKERLRVVLVVNGKVRDEVQVELSPSEGAEAEFHWVAYLARNEVKVVAERA